MLGADEAELAANPPPAAVMMFTRSFIGAAEQSLLFSLNNNTRVRAARDTITSAPLEECCCGAESSAHFLTGAPVGGSQYHRLRVTVNRGGAAKLLSQPTFHYAGGKKEKPTRYKKKL